MTTILVIEDTSSILENILEILEIENFRAMGAEDGVAGVQLAKQHLPDLIICDIMMPKLDGYGVLLELRSDPATARIPFIFLTAKTARAAMRHGMILGADDYLTKPFTASELLAAVNTRLERHETISREYEQKLVELRGNIVLMLPHELRTPLTSILGYSEILMANDKTLSSGQVVQMAQSIHCAGQRLYRLTENFLAYAQTEIIRGDPQRIEALQELHVAHPKEPVESLVRQKAAQVDRQADLTLAVEDTPTVQISLAHLERIVEELVDNAFKFSRPGTPVLIAATVDDRQYRLRISDRGRGMTPEQITRIGAYVQFERALYEQQGTGLGLIIAKRLVELHGGKLTIESKPDEETTVYATLPLK